MSKKHRNRRASRQVGVSPLAPIVYDQPRVGRNDPCPCGCGRKFKQCTGRPQPSTQQNKMNPVYTEDQQKNFERFIYIWGFEPNPAQLMMFATGDPEEIQENVLQSMDIVGKQTGADFKQFAYAIKHCGRLLTPKNEELWSQEEIEQWELACKDFDAQQEVPDIEE